jgi:hypothetical protein
MVPLLAALIATFEPTVAPLGGTAWIFATVGHSEFCPAGNVTVDVRTGRYTLTARAARRVCNDVRLERPARQGTLSPQKLAAVRTAYQRVLSEGLESQVCQEGGRPQDLVISNGSTPILVLTNGRASHSAPGDVGCWSEATTALHDALDRVFSPADYR